jgi:hypothetical protein
MPKVVLSGKFYEFPNLFKNLVIVPRGRGLGKITFG